MMRFILGAVAGFAAGVAASTLSSGKLGRELRDELDGIRADLEKRDYEAVGNRLEARFKDLQSSFEQRLAEAKEASEGAADTEGEAAEALDKAAADVSEVLEDAVEEAKPA
jgi:gas vesicle protein